MGLKFRKLFTYGDRPKIRLRLNSADWVTEIAAIIFLVLLIGLPVLYFNDLHGWIPIHLKMRLCGKVSA